MSLLEPGLINCKWCSLISVWGSCGYSGWPQHSQITCQTFKKVAYSGSILVPKFDRWGCWFDCRQLLISEGAQTFWMHSGIHFWTHLQYRDAEFLKIILSFISTLMPILKCSKPFIIVSKIICQKIDFKMWYTPLFFFPFPDYRRFSWWPLESRCTNHWLEDVSSIETCQGAWSRRRSIALFLSVFSNLISIWIIRYIIIITDIIQQLETNRVQKVT